MDAKANQRSKRQTSQRARRARERASGREGKQEQEQAGGQRETPKRQAGAAAAGGMPVAVYEWSSGLLIFFLGFVLAPRYVRERLTTVPEWFERRFGPKCRLLLALVSVAAYVLTKIAASLFAGAVLMEVVLGVSMWVSSPIILAFTALYAASGGLSAVMYTDVGQAPADLCEGHPPETA